MSHERRRFTRIQFENPGELDSPQGIFDVQVLDLSINGALVQTLEDSGLVSGMVCNLHLPLSAEAFIIMAVEVAHIEDLWIGLRCLEMDLDSITHLRRLIELHLGEPALLERDLLQLVADRGSVIEG